MSRHAGEQEQRRLVGGADRRCGCGEVGDGEQVLAVGAPAGPARPTSRSAYAWSSSSSGSSNAAPSTPPSAGRRAASAPVAATARGRWSVVPARRRAGAQSGDGADEGGAGGGEVGAVEGRCGRARGAGCRGGGVGAAADAGSGAGCAGGSVVVVVVAPCAAALGRGPVGSPTSSGRGRCGPEGDSARTPTARRRPPPFAGGRKAPGPRAWWRPAPECAGRTHADGEPTEPGRTPCLPGPTSMPAPTSAATDEPLPTPPCPPAATSTAVRRRSAATDRAAPRRLVRAAPTSTARQSRSETSRDERRLVPPDRRPRSRVRRRQRQTSADPSPCPPHRRPQPRQRRQRQTRAERRRLVPAPMSLMHERRQPRQEAAGAALSAGTDVRHHVARNGPRRTPRPTAAVDYARPTARRGPGARRGRARLLALLGQGLLDVPEGQTGRVALAGEHPGEPAHAGAVASPVVERSLRSTSARAVAASCSGSRVATASAMSSSSTPLRRSSCCSAPRRGPGRGGGR